MIGISAILMDVAFIALGLFMLTGAMWNLIDGRRRRPAHVFNKNDVDRTHAPLVVVIITLLWLAAVSNLFLREVRFHSDLSGLRPDTVDQIAIGNQTITDRRQIAQVVDILNHAEWFSLSRGDAADKVPFVISLVSGKRYDYQATRYQHGAGAALISYSLSGWNNGEAFCLRLPESLARAGITLPPCLTFASKPVHCAAQ